MIDKNLLRSNRAALIELLESAGAKFRGNACNCVFHEDHHPSAGVYQKGGVWRFKCLSCGEIGDIFDLRAKFNRTSAAAEIRKVAGPVQLQRQAAPKKNEPTFASLDAVRAYMAAKIGKIEAEYVYLDAAGDAIQTVFRSRTKDGKTFRPVHLTDKGYELSAAPKPWPVYGLPLVTNAETVVICEGERCADVLARYGFKACTSAGGAKNARSSDWAPLAGKSIILWPDHDAEGRRYIADVEVVLQGLNPLPRLSIIDPAQLDLAESEDVANFVEQLKVIGKSDAEIATALTEAIETAKPLSLANDVRQRIADIRMGRYAAISWPWNLVSALTKALLPGTVTLLAGSVGATKSFVCLQCFAYWMSLGLRAALYEVEEDRTFHLTRSLAQVSRCANLTDPDWVKENADAADGIAQEHAAFLDRFGRVIYAAPDAQPSLEQLGAWVQEQARRGCRIIGIDPVTMAARTGEPWTADGRFLQSIKRTATDYGCSVLLVTHPVKQCSFPDLTQLAGSACYQRFAQTILWLEHHQEKTSRVRMACGTTEIEHNRTLHILKARNGRGGGFKLAFGFDIESLSLNEHGIIVKQRGA